MITSMFLCAHRHGNLITRELAVGLCPFLSLVVRFGRSAAQILQSGPRQLGQVGCAPCSPSGGPFWPHNGTYPALPLGGGGVGWGEGGVGWDDNVHVRARTQARQPHHTRAGGGSLSPSLPGRFGRSAAQILKTDLASLVSFSLLSLWWSVLAAQQPESFKTDLPSSSTGVGVGWGGGWGWGGMITSMFLCTHRHGNLITRELAVGLCPFLSLVVRFGRSAAQILQNGPRQLGQVGCAPCSPCGGPCWPLSSPNPSKRTYPALPLGGGGVGWDDNVYVLVRTQARQPHHTRAGGGSLSPSLLGGPLLALPLVVRFGRSAAQILQNGPRQLGLLGCAPCSPSGQRPMRLEEQGRSVLTDLGC